MKALVAVLVLLLATTAVAQEGEGSNGGALDSATNFILGVNPVILIIAGIVLFFASNLAKLIAIALVLIGIASLVVSLL